MSRSSTGRWLSVLLLFWVGGFIAAFGYSFFTFPQDDILSFFRLPWSFASAAQLLIEYLPALTPGSMLVSFSLLFPSFRQERMGGKNFFVSVFPGIIAWGMMLTLIYAFGAEILLPSVQRRLNDMTYQSRRAQEYERLGDELEQAGEYADALEAYERALIIDPDNFDLVRKQERLEGQIPLFSSRAAEPVSEDAASQRDSAAEPPPPPRVSSEADAVTALKAAREAIEREDFFTAHYWAIRAGVMDPEQRTVASQLAREAWDAIALLEPGKEQLDQYGHYHRKIEGYKALEESDPVKAYAIFLELHGTLEGANDPDVKEFLERSRIEVEKVSFYDDTARQAETMPGITNVLFRDPPSGPFVSARKMVTLEGKVFLLGFELMFIDDEGVTLHVTAPAALFQSGGLLLRGIDENSGEIVQHATILKGEARLYQGESWSADLKTGFVKLATDAREMWRLGSDGGFLQMTDIVSLYRSARSDEAYGYYRFPTQLELIFRLSRPFFFLNLFILGVGLGRFLRFRGHRPPLTGFLVIPLVPFMVKWLIELLAYMVRLIAALLVLNLSIVPAAVAMVTFHGIVLFAVLIFSSGYRDS
jgi:tetratricopeptide (TPR) repeat protein